MIYYPCAYSKFETLKMLVTEFGADLKLRDFYNRSPLMYAVQGKRTTLEMVKWIIEQSEGFGINDTEH